MLIKQESITSQKLDSCDFRRIANTVLNKSKVLQLLYLMVPRSCRLHLIKQNCLPKTFSKNSNLDDSGISLLGFPFRTNLKLHILPVTPKLVKKITTNLGFSKGIWFWLFSSGGYEEL